jgi:RimJ/RimL family protein N-acetyltransferase
MSFLDVFRHKDWRVQQCVGPNICDGCVRFGEQMAGTKEGVEALHNRFWGPTTRCDFGPIRVCAMPFGENVPLGVCDAAIEPGNRKEAQVGILVNPDQQGKGVGKDLLKGVGKILKNNGVEKIYSEIRPNNLKAQSVAFKLGAQMEMESFLVDPDNRGTTRWVKKL